MARPPWHRMGRGEERSEAGERPDEYGEPWTEGYEYRRLRLRGSARGGYARGELGPEEPYGRHRRGPEPLREYEAGPYGSLEERAEEPPRGRPFPRGGPPAYGGRAGYGAREYGMGEDREGIRADDLVLPDYGRRVRGEEEPPVRLEGFGEGHRGYAGWGSYGGRGWAGDEGFPDLQPHPRDRGPKGYRRSDARIHEEVCERLMQQPGVDCREVEVEVQDGEVILRGEAPDRRTKQQIEAVAERVLGVEDVLNYLRLRRGAEPATPGERVRAGEGEVGHGGGVGPDERAGPQH